MRQYEKSLVLWRKKGSAIYAENSEALKEFAIAFAYNSGKIENDKITYRDTRKIFERGGAVSYSGDLKTLVEIRNAKEAYEFFLVSFVKRRPMDEEFIKETHRLLTQSTYDTMRLQLGERPGEYKKHDFVTGKEEVGAPPEDVSEEMAELLDEIQDVPDEKILTAAAYFHAKIENIHPFADGNGRTGRLAMNYLLVLHGHPPIVIHEEDRNEYYDALEAWDKSQLLEPMCVFLRQQAVKTWEKQSRQV